MDGKNGDELEKKDLTKENFRRESSLSASSSTLYKKVILTLLREQMSSSRSLSFFFNLGDVPLKVTHPVSTKCNQLVERTARERVMGFNRREVLRNANDDVLPRSFVGLIQILCQNVYLTEMYRDCRLSGS